ncbi:MAG: 2Fe-2S iron-sulfur cluster binding domain-containing protein, partial [Chloroflexi bacterium]
MDQGPSRRAGRDVGEGGTNAVIQRKLEVTYLPFDRSTRVPPGTTVFSAAHWIGLPIDSTCGGRGTCGKCKVRILGTPTEITDADHRELRQDEIAGGW